MLGAICFLVLLSKALVYQDHNTELQKTTRFAQTRICTVVRGLVLSCMTLCFGADVAPPELDVVVGADVAPLELDVVVGAGDCCLF